MYSIDSSKHSNDAASSPISGKDTTPYSTTYNSKGKDPSSEQIALDQENLWIRKAAALYSENFSIQETKNELGSGSYGSVIHVTANYLGSSIELAKKILTSSDATIESYMNAKLSKYICKEILSNACEILKMSCHLVPCLGFRSSSESSDENSADSSDNIDDFSSDIDSSFYRTSATISSSSEDEIEEDYEEYEEEVRDTELFFEKVDGKTIDTKTIDGMSTTRRLEIMQDICKALSLLNKANIVHRDLKLSNVMIDNNTGKARLIDLGFAIDREDLTQFDRKQNKEDPSNYSELYNKYCAPIEIFKEPKISKNELFQYSYDIYGLGMMTLSLLFGKFGEQIVDTYFQNFHHVRGLNANEQKKSNINPKELNAQQMLLFEHEQFYKDIDKNVDECNDNQPTEKKYSSDQIKKVKQLMRDMLDPTPESRPNADKVSEKIQEII